MAVTRSTLRLARQLRRDIGTEVDDAVRALTADWVRAWDRLAPAWRSAVGELVDVAVQLQRWPYPVEILRMGEVDRAMRGTIAALDKLAERTETVAREGADRIVQLDAEREPRIVASQAPVAEESALAQRVQGLAATEALRESWALRENAQDDVRLTVVSRIRTDAVNVMAARAGQQVHASTLPLSPQAVEAVRRNLVNGIDVGANPRTAAARMLADVQGQFNGGLTRALNISRTEMLDAYRTTSQQIHSANADVVPGWQWLSTFDTRVCPSCISMHGTRFPAAEPGPIDHQSGRCARLPVLASWAELGITAPEPPSMLPNAEEWFNGLPRASQLQIMGPGRLQLLDDRLIGWGDLSMVRQVPGWRPSRVPAPLRDLDTRATRGLPPTPGPSATTLPAPARPAAPVRRVEAPAPRRLSPGDAQQMQNRMLADDPWTPAQRLALERYSDQWYQEANELLRGHRNPADLPPAFRATIQETIRDVAAGLRPLPHDVIVTRRVQAEAFGIGRDEFFDVGTGRLRQALAGQVRQEPAFMSTTIGQSRPNFGPVLMEIRVPAGTPAAYIESISAAQGQGEFEMLLGPGLRFRILDVVEPEPGLPPKLIIEVLE